MVKIRFRAVRKFAFEFELPLAVYVLVFAGTLLSLVTSLVVHFSGGNITTATSPHGSTIVVEQPKRELELGAITPSKAEDIVDNGGTLSTDPAPMSQPRSVVQTKNGNQPDAGHYYAWVRLQGDGQEGEYEKVKRRCVPNRDMPPPCFIPHGDREIWALPAR